MNYNILYFIGTVVTLSLYYVLQDYKKKSTKLIGSDTVDMGFGFISNVYPILTIYTSGNYFKNKPNPLPLTNPDGIPEDHYFVASFDNNFTDYLGAIPSEKMLEIKKLLVNGTADELLKTFSSTSAPDVNKKYYEDRIEFAKQQLEMS